MFFHVVPLGGDPSSEMEAFIDNRPKKPVGFNGIKRGELFAISTPTGKGKSIYDPQARVELVSGEVGRMVGRMSIEIAGVRRDIQPTDIKRVLS